MARADHSEASESPQPAAAALAGAVLLAAVASLWALFQWTQLLEAQRGHEVFCGFGGGGGQCAHAWSSPFAKGVHDLTGLPVAGWGLVWGLVAMALPLGALVRRADGRSLEPFWSATLLTAIGGVLACMGLATLLITSGQLCATCVLTYGIVIAYAALCLSQGARVATPRGGLGLAAGVGALAFAVLLVPGLRSAPPDDALAALPEPVAPGDPPTADAPARDAAAPATPRDDALGDYLASLPPPAREAVGRALREWMEGPATPVRAARSLVGPADAPVRITEFADTLCGHCADLHRTLGEIRRRVPPESFAIEPRQFPLDGACNPQIERASEDGVRCTAARALICLEDQPGSWAFASSLFEQQRQLDEARILEAAAPYLPEDELRRCMASAETRARLQEDIDWAVERGIRGTPLVLVNGRKAPPLPPFLYALVLAGGDPAHPAFADL